MDTAFADTTALRAEAGRLLDEVVGNVLAAVDDARRTHWETSAFGRYDVAPVYSEAADAWRGELNALSEAVEQLVEKIRKSATDYDGADHSSAENLSRIR